MSLIRILVSSCLLGEPVRYDGTSATAQSALLAQWKAEGRLLPFCPEVAGGFPVPRPPAEIAGQDGLAVLRGKSTVVLASNREVTSHFVLGASQALQEAQEQGAKLAILKDGSPSCGSSYIYDGSFTGRRRSGQGVTTALLERQGIRVFSEHRIEAAASYLSLLEERA